MEARPHHRQIPRLCADSLPERLHQYRPQRPAVAPIGRIFESSKPGGYAPLLPGPVGRQELAGLELRCRRRSDHPAAGPDLCHFAGSMVGNFEAPASDGYIARLSAYRAKDLKPVWTFQQRAPFLTSVMTTAGGVGFVGDWDRTFRAFDVKTGKTLWTTRLGTTAQGFPDHLQRRWRAIRCRSDRLQWRQPRGEARHAARFRAQPSLCGPCRLCLRPSKKGQLGS